MGSSKFKENSVLRRLKKAVKCRDVRSVMHLLRDNRDISKSQLNDKLMHRLFHGVKVDPEQQTPIIEILKLFLDRGADVNIKNNDGHTVLHVAIKKRATKVIDFLISRNANVDVRDAFGDPIIHFLVREECARHNSLRRSFPKIEFEKERLDFIEWMILKGLDVDSQDEKGGTALLYTLRHHRHDFAKLLLEYSKNVDVRNKNGDTALNIVVAGDYQSERSDLKKEAKETICVLLDKGADIHKTNNDGYSPVAIAVENRNRKLLKLFKERGADFRRCYRKGNLLHYFFKSLKETHFKNYKAILDFLLDEGCDVNTKDDNGMTPLHFAARRVDPDIVIKLIERGANVNSREFISYYTPLHEAVEYRNENLILMLIEKGADVNAKTKRGRTALHLINSNLKDATIEVYYVGRGSLDRELMRLSRRIDDTFDMFQINTRLERNEIAGTSAGKYILPMLIDHGAHIDVRDNDGFLPLQAAILRRDDEIVKELLRYGVDINDNTHVLSVNDYKLVFEAIREHLVKLQVAELPIDDKFKSLLASNFSEIHEDCLFEVEKLKKFSITESLSLYSFLQMNRNSKCVYVKNKKLQELISSADFQKKFPMYHVLISSECYIAVERQKMLEPARCVWLKYTDILLPDLCIYEILNHLSNVDLRIMIEETR